MQTQLKSHPAKCDRFTKLLLVGMLSAIALPSCSAGYNATSGALMERETTQAPIQNAKMAAAPAMQPAPSGDIVAAREENFAAAAPARRSLPQLIKRAELTLVVQSIDKSMRDVSNLVRKQQGDIIGFQDSKPTDPSSRATASMQIRVPSSKLETSLDSLAKLGNVQSRSLTAEDVSDQLVDFQARLKNLRKSEEAVLKILERSGSIRDVLQVTQQLSNIRESIERISAQLKNLQNQVAYSTITLNLEATVPAAPPAGTPLGLRVQETWGQATHSLSEVSYGLLSFSIWLFAFSPYILLIGGAGYGIYRLKKYKSHMGDRKPNLPPSA
ncbi:DUF4349 domain-containing protein [Aerosakkonema funiforme]|uniref:DUF4349 domain-containing protein n=1 Tax=Aerosakkonema funiforme TaxID=1246630 RepID=UPI0035B7D548